MKYLTKILSAVAILAAVAVAHAQQISAPQQEAQSPGLLGKRTAYLGFGYVDIKHTQNDQWFAMTSVNAPVMEGLDVSASYDYAWLESDGNHHIQDLNLAGTTFTTWGTVKPFLTGGIGYTWPHNLASVNRLTYNTAAGIEVEAASNFALTFSGGYAADFKAGDNSTFSANVGANVWVTKNVAAVATVSLFDGGHVGYALGLAYRF